MLINEPKALELDFIANIIGQVNGNTESPREIQTGIYQRPDFGSSHFLPGYREYVRKLSIASYGVCDNPDQILEQCPELQDENRQFVITLTPVIKKNQSSEGGWRWHKWGLYIGKHKPQCEYLYDEPKIDEVFVYHIYEK